MRLPEWLLRLIGLKRRAFARRATCSIAWQPSVVAPVFYGARDYSSADGAPTNCRVFFPSLDGAVFDAPILEGCGRYPLILFAHGNCAESEHFKKWFLMPAQLARSGTVVVVPYLPATAGGAYPWETANSDLPLLQNVASWARQTWVHKSLLLPPPATGIVGHSYGALLAARFAADGNVTAYASLSGGWAEWPSSPPLPLERLTMPKLFMWGTGFTDVFAALSEARWGSLATPKHAAMLQDAEHWDYLRAGSSSCESGRGPCDLTPVLAGDILTTFFGKYLPPEDWSQLGVEIPDSLLPPPLSLTRDQQFFAGNHLMSMGLIGSRPGCSITLRWEVSSDRTGSVTRP